MTTPKPQDENRLPMLPRAAAGTDAEALRRLRRFHVDPGTAADDTLNAGVLPALLAPYGQVEELRTDAPFFVGTPGEEGALCLTLPDLLTRLAPAVEASRVLADNLPRLERQIRRRAAQAGAPVEARELLQQAGEGLLEELDLGADDHGRLEGDLEALLAEMPAGGRFLPFDADTPLHLLLAAAASRLGPAREAFAAEVRELAELLGGMLEADRRKGAAGREAGALGAGMGQAAGSLINPEALAGVVQSRRGVSTLAPERRASLEQALAALGEVTAEPASLVLVHDAAEGAPLGLEGVRAVESEEPLAAAAELFDEEAEKLARVLRAVRVARLETQGKYDPERHDPWLARLDWQAFSREEMALLPTVVVRVGAEAAARGGMLALSRLLLSGRPVQVLMTVDPAADPGAAEDDPLSGFRFEPAYLGVSHREAWVQQGSAARPAQLMEGFRRALAGTRGALHVAAVPPPVDATEKTDSKAAGSRGLAWLAAGAALEGRAHPVFRYDPEAGASWARRFDFTGNPEPEEDWPRGTLACRREDGQEQTLELTFTFADFALLSPLYRGHFQPVAEGVPEAELTPLAEWLEEPEETHTVPFVWGVGTGKLLRLAVSRPLALACRDRLGFWRTLQELAGVKSEYVREAQQRAAEEAERRLAEERERLAAEHAAELERVRATAAEEVANRLTAALLELDVAAFAAPAAGAGFGDGFAGKSVDEVTRTLLTLVDPETLATETAAPGGAQVDEMAAELLKLVGSELEEA
jgi:hypothetical protein